MAILKLDNDIILTQESEIQRELASLNIQITSYSREKSVELAKLLEQDVLSYSEKNQIIQSHKIFLDSLKQEVGYLCYDLLVLHPGSPNLYSLTTTYSRYHIHQDAEALYILSGSAIFGFVRSDGSHIELQLSERDYIYIPAGCEHWFSPSTLLHLKAVRFFTTAEGWMPQYTNRTLNLGIH